MPICPSCGTKQSRRADGMCPNCLADIILYKGEWYLASEGSPNQIIVALFEQYVSEKLSTSSRKVVWDIRKGTERHKRELGFAKQLLKDCGDLETTKEILHEAFYGEKFGWKSRQSLKSVLGDASLLLAIVRAKQTEENQKAHKEQQAFDQVMSREDIFK